MKTGEAARRRLASGIALLAMTASLFGGLPLAAKKSVTLRLAEADTAFRQLQYKRALRLFARATEEPEGRFRGHLGQARVYQALDRFREGLEQASKAVEAAGTDEERSVAHNLRGLLLAGRADRVASTGDDYPPRQRYREEAVAAYREALALANGEAPTVLRNLAEVQARMHRIGEGRETIKRLLELDPGSAGSVAGLREYLDCLEDSRLTGEFRDFDSVELVPPKRLYAPTPQVRPELRPVDGVAHFEMVIDQTGTPHCGRVLMNRSLPRGFLADALETLSTWRFEPARLKGEPVSVSYLMTVTVR